MCCWVPTSVWVNRFFHCAALKSQFNIKTQSTCDVKIITIIHIETFIKLYFCQQIENLGEDKMFIELSFRCIQRYSMISTEWKKDTKFVTREMQHDERRRTQAIWQTVPCLIVEHSCVECIACEINLFLVSVRGFFFFFLFVLLCKWKSNAKWMLFDSVNFTSFFPSFQSLQEIVRIETSVPFLFLCAMCVLPYTCHKLFSTKYLR